LTTALQSTGELEEGRRVASVEVMPISEENKGLMSTLGFLAMEFDGETSCTKTMVVKMAVPASDFELRVLTKLTKMISTEIGYLQLNQQSTPIVRAPHLYYAHLEEATQSFVLLMEDLRPAQVRSQVTGCDVSDAERILRLLAKMHAAFWESKTIATKGFPVTAADHKSKRFVDMVVHDAWPKFLKWAKEVELANLEPCTAVGEEVVKSKRRWQQHMAVPPLTLVHGDSHCENFMLCDDDSVVAIDFQLCAIGQGAFDVANFLVMSMEGEVLEKEADKLLKVYYDSLVEQHQAQHKNSPPLSESYSFAEFQRRYQAGICYTLMLEAVGQGTASPAELANEATQRKRKIIFSRISRAISRMDRPSLFFPVGNETGGVTATPAAVHVALSPSGEEQEQA
jgi:thiamine kinase-like enzyme